MLTFETELGKVHLVQNLNELPDLKNSDRLIIDTETTSNDPKVKALRPYMGHRILGYAISADNLTEAWYIPIRHRNYDKDKNLPIDKVSAYVQELLDTCKEVVNHNIKFDMHFMHQDGIEFKRGLKARCTLQQAKLIDSERFDHGLKSLGKEWLGRSMDNDARLSAYLESVGSKDYGDIPLDILAPYAGDDVLIERELDNFTLLKKDSELDWVWENESKLILTLFDMETIGLKVDLKQLKIYKYHALKAMIDSATIIEQATDTEFTNSNQNLHEIIVNFLGLPILAWGDPTKDGTVNPKFDKATLKTYKTLPEVVVDPEKKALLDAIFVYRKNSQFKSLYLDGWENVMGSDGRIYPMYNPNVRTGRMSGFAPNITQLNLLAKTLIVPDEGEFFWSLDASQVEFRWIVEYLNQHELIQEYIKNPRTDFHSLIASLVDATRQTGKTLNFANGFGAGKKRNVKILSAADEVLEKTLDEVNGLIESGTISLSEKASAVRDVSKRMAEYVYNTYHEKLYNLKERSKQAETKCKQRGYVRNLYGRRRHIYRDLHGKVRLYRNKVTGRVFDRAYVAFNTANQGTAMDYVKARMNATAPRYNDHIRSLGLRQRASVHDEMMVSGPLDLQDDPALTRYMLDTLSDTAPVKTRIPFLWDGATSSKSWADAKEKPENASKPEPENV